MVEHQYLWVNGVQLHYVIAGDGRPMVFLHGFPDFWYVWKDQLAHFRRNYQVIAPDLRGYNLSGKPVGVEHYRLPVVVEDIRGLVDHVGQPIVLIAHDWGAVVAWEFAARYPTLLTKLVILSTPPLEIVRRTLHDSEERRTQEYRLMVISPQAEQILSAGDYALFKRTIFDDHATVPPDHFTDADRVAYEEAWSQPGAITGGVNYYRAARFHDYYSESERQSFLDWWTRPEWNIAGERFYEGLTPVEVFGPARDVPVGDQYGDTIGSNVVVPTLFLIGERDVSAQPTQFTRFQQCVPHGQLVHIPNAGHRVIHEQSTVVTKHIQRFLAEQGNTSVQ